jgi:HK97 family phage major capsid protein
MPELLTRQKRNNQLPDDLLHRTAIFQRGSIDKKNRTAELAFSSETDKVERWFGIEILDHGPASIRLDRIGNKAPLLIDHNAADQVGVIESVKIGADRVARAIVRFSKGSRGNDIFSDVVDGIRTKVSVGYLTHAREETNEGTEHKPIFRVTDWEPYEISIVSIPADDSVGIGRTANTTYFEDTNMPEQQTNESEVKLSRSQKTAARLAVEDERLRIAEITSIAGNRGLQNLGQTYIDNGKSLDEFRAAVLDSMPEPKAAPSADVMYEGRGNAYGNHGSRTFSIRNAILGQLPGSNIDNGYEREVSQGLARQFGKNPSSILVPIGMPSRDDRTMQVSVAGTGGNISPYDYRPDQLVDALVAESAILNLPIMHIPDAVGDVILPRVTSNMSVGWSDLDSVDSIAATDPTFDQITFSPTSITAITKLSHKLLKQSTPQADAIIQNMLALEIAKEFDLKCVQGDGTLNTITGIINTTGIGNIEYSNGGSPTWANAVGVEALLAANNVSGVHIAYLMHPIMAAALKTTTKDAGSGRFILEDGVMNGRQVVVSTNVPAGTIIVGSWQQFVTVTWGVLEILVDPYGANLATGDVSIRAILDVDAGVRHPEAFATLTEAAV